MLSTVSGRWGAFPIVGAERQVWLRSAVEIQITKVRGMGSVGYSHVEMKRCVMLSASMTAAESPRLSSYSATI